MFKIRNLTIIPQNIVDELTLLAYISQSGNCI